jgi:hypothetical protein
MFKHLPWGTKVMEVEMVCCLNIDNHAGV